MRPSDEPSLGVRIMKLCPPYMSSGKLKLTGTISEQLESKISNMFVHIFRNEGFVYSKLSVFLLTF